MSKNQNPRKLLIAGGGTGGHILAGVAIADAWREKLGQKGSESVLFIGAKQGLEQKLVPKAGYSLVSLPVGTLNRVGLVRQLKTIFQIPWAMAVSFYQLLKFQPHSVLGVGGYSSGPVVLMAAIMVKLRLLRAEVGLLEQNSVLGLTNRILSKWVDVLFLAFSGMESLFPGKKVVFTGNPIRSTMKPMKSAARTPFVIFVFGGSQGARGINQLVVDSLPELKNEPIQFVHQTGEADFEKVQLAYRETGVKARIEKFIYDMPEVYQSASLLICRSGSSTLAEIAAVGRASILIPLPTAADGHQQKNAMAYSRIGASVVLDQTKTTGKALAHEIQQFIKNPERLSDKETKVTQFFRPNAAQDVVEFFLNSR